MEPWPATRSSNALDELYYAIVDEYCYEALAANVGSDNVWRSALSPAKAASPYLSEGTGRLRSQWFSTALYWLGVPLKYSGRGPRMREVASVSFPTGSSEYVSVCAEDGFTAQGKDLRLTVHYPLQLLGVGFKKDDVIDIPFLYLTETKALCVRSDAMWEADTFKGKPKDVSTFLKKHGIAKRAAI